MDYDKKFLKVEVHPVHEKFWGIRNLTETAWRVVGNEGNEKLIKTDEVLTMVEGLNIDFGTALGSIKLGTNRRKPQ
jgi:methylthioribose-1-phosphate isomerase